MGFLLSPYERKLFLRNDHCCFFWTSLIYNWQYASWYIQSTYYRYALSAVHCLMVWVEIGHVCECRNKSEFLFFIPKNIWADTQPD